jgi:hypothetical protein
VELRIKERKRRYLMEKCLNPNIGKGEMAHAEGRYVFKCFDSEGNLRWEDVIENVVCTEGKNVMLDAALAGSGYSVVGPYMGLINGSGYSAPVAGDTMLSHVNWTEFTTYLTPNSGGTNVRPTCAWSSAASGSKSLSAALTFYMTAGGSVAGGFICFGTGATNTPANTGGKLWSAGPLSGGTKTVNSGDTLQVSYTTSL